MKKYFMKTLAVMIAVTGIPTGILLSRGLKTPWYGNYVAVTSPSAIHWHVVIGIWIAFALAGLFVWCLDRLFVQKKPGKFILAASTVIFLLGGLSGYLIGFRRGATQPWAPPGYGAPQVVIPSAVEWPIVMSLWVLFFVLATVLLALVFWCSKKLLVK